MWAAIKKILPLNINKLGLGPILAFGELNIEWDNLLTGILGFNFKNVAKPVSIKNNILVVDCLNSVWASELQIHQEKIIAQVNKFFKKEPIQKIIFIC
ncbi:MAG: hypothetical protein A2174_02145 [Candidatus Portnoybacteria bacterium RBG_13_41_18]|uniref:DUF721 domain-containing protein n=1 Tax=Candidatus Portnoybacteria bacterium RBG_13_41_18 TaxID=1801991 RepID=A0A1G2F8A7_9BACT|nr:MAG: hypothetical protein A2174_02145 [Candidatus Portnoybacteria bacterium RBG_13_41_18]